MSKKQLQKVTCGHKTWGSRR